MAWGAVGSAVKLLGASLLALPRRRRGSRSNSSTDAWASAVPPEQATLGIRAVERLLDPAKRVARAGLEPATPRFSAVSLYRLSYRPAPGGNQSSQ